MRQRVGRVQGHLLLMMRNARTTDFNEDRVSVIVAGLVFIMARRSWNTPVHAPANKRTDFEIPEHIVFEAAHTLRRRVIEWIRSGSRSPSGVDSIGDAAVRVSSTAGVLRPSDRDVPQQWAFVNGGQNIGRPAAIASRSTNACTMHRCLTQYAIRDPAHELAADTQYAIRDTRSGSRAGLLIRDTQYAIRDPAHELAAGAPKYTIRKRNAQSCSQVSSLAAHTQTASPYSTVYAVPSYAADTYRTDQ